MNIRISRYLYGPSGIFSYMYDSNGKQIAECLEHVFLDADGKFVPKVAEGKYTCVRHPPNRLPYETFMLKDVPDFQDQPVTGILIHVGNFNRDSDGCFLIGQKSVMSDIWGKWILNSRQAFSDFMKLQKGVNEFELTVERNS